MQEERELKRIEQADTEIQLLRIIAEYVVRSYYN